MEVTPELLAEIERLGGLSMKLKHALVWAGAPSAYVDDLINDLDVVEAYERGKLRSLEECTQALKQAARDGVVSAVKLVIGRHDTKVEPMSAYEQRALRKRAVTQADLDLIASVDAAFARQRQLLELGVDDDN